MKYYELEEARENFDQILDEVQEQDITITKDGEEVAVVIGKKSQDVLRYLNAVMREKDD
jgi:prevent-host-death family protein